MIKKELNRLIHAFGYSIDGIKAAFQSEPAFRIELLLTVILVPVAIALNISQTQRMLLISSIILVLLAELINTAIETIIDYISTAKHPMAKKAKDIGSALVLLAIVQWLYLWGTILCPLIFN